MNIMYLIDTPAGNPTLTSVEDRVIIVLDIIPFCIVSIAIQSFNCP